MSIRNTAPKALLASAAITFAFIMAGCSVQGASVEDPKPATVEETTEAEAEAPAVEEPVEEDPAPEDMILEFGQTITYEDGMQLMVSPAAPFTPTPYAAGVVDGQDSVYMTIKITNGTDAKFQPMGLVTASSGGKEASAIFDMDGEVELSGAPMTPVLPGKSITWMEGFSVADVEDITLDVSPSYEYLSATFTTSK